MATPSNPPPVPHVPGYQAGVPPAGYRAMKDSEITPELSQKAMDIFKQTRNQPYGTQVEFEIDGQKYTGRKEQHWHPQGYKGETINGQHWGPSGFHPGVSMYKSIEQVPAASGPTASGREQFFQRLMNFLQSLEKEV